MKSKWFVFFIALSLLIVAGYAFVNLICQHRAVYSGSITFIGGSRYVFSSRYTRVNMWRDAKDTSSLPKFTLHLGDESYPLEDFTPEVVTALGGSLESGSFRDSSNMLLQYRFENGRLTWFSLDSAGPPSSLNNVSRVSLSIGDGEPFTLPIDHGTLVKYAGKPERTYLNFAQ